MKKLSLLALLLSTLCSHAAERTLLLVVGTPGAESYKIPFQQQVTAWQAAATPEFTVTTLQTKAALQESLRNISNECWIVLIGHGTYDGKHARFNIEGPDLSPEELNSWLAPNPHPTVVINCTAASGPFLKTLSHTNRTVITATRSGMETSYSHFSEQAIQAFAQREAADLDKDHALSVLEIFLYTSRRVKEFYENDGRIQTETALIDDNGDGKGMEAEAFIGSRPDISRIKEGQPDGYKAMQQVLLAAPQPSPLSAAQTNERDELEQQVFRLREQRPALGDEAYFQQLEPLLLKLGTFYPAPKP